MNLLSLTLDSKLSFKHALIISSNHNLAITIQYYVNILKMIIYFLRLFTHKSTQ